MLCRRADGVFSRTGGLLPRTGLVVSVSSGRSLMRTFAVRDLVQTLEETLENPCGRAPGVT
jgi:hypothetical protein